MAYERKVIDISEVEKQLEICRSLRGRIGVEGRQPLAMVDTYGCQQNEADSEKLRGYLAEMGCGFTQDEFEAEEARDFFPIGPNQYIASGAMALFDLEEALPELGEIESDSGVSTIGGHITDCLGHMAEVNEKIRIRDFVFTVTGTDGRRVTQTRIERIPAAAPATAN